MNKFLKILIFTLLLWLISCQNNEVKNISTVSVLEDSVETSINRVSKNNNNFCKQFIEKWEYYQVWSDTKPQINKTHIFCGEINSRWKPTWFHSMPDWIIPETVQIVKKENINKFGVYNAKIEVYDIKNKKFKNKFSSVFPDKLSEEEVEKAILNAWENKKYYKNSKFQWPSGLGFEIAWYTYKWNKKINTAYPIYKK
jgi:hypothetical protein